MAYIHTFLLPLYLYNIDSMNQPYRRESIVTKHATIIEENKQKRKVRGEYYEGEPEPLIFDMKYADFIEEDEEGNYLPAPPWQHTNLISLECIQDIFGDDFRTVQKLLLYFPEVYLQDDGSQYVYYREEEILRAIEILTTLAKSNFVNTLRPQYQFIKDNEPVYSNKDMMNILDVKEERLRKFRDEGYLGYTKYPNSDKYWYTKKNLEDFLNNPIAKHEPWK